MLKSKVKNKEQIDKKNDKVKKSKFKKVLKFLAAGVIGYTVLVGASNNLFENSIRSQVSAEMIAEYNKIYNIIEHKENYINYINNYQYSDEMLKKDQERFEKFDGWIADKYSEVLSKYDLSDKKTTKEMIIKMLNENEELFFDKAHIFEDIYSTNNIIMSSREISELILKIYAISNVEKYSGLSRNEKRNYIFKNFINKKGRNGLSGINYNESIQMDIFFLKKHIVEKDNIYAYSASENMSRELNIENYKNAKRDFSEGQNMMFEIVKNNNKEITEITGIGKGRSYEELSKKEKELIFEIAQKNYQKILDIKIKNTLKLKSDEGFRRESFKNMSANRFLINKVKNIRQNKNADNNYDNLMKNEYISSPMNFVGKKLEESGISVGFSSPNEKDVIEFAIMMELTGVQKEIWRSYVNKANYIIYDEIEDYFTFMK